MNNEPERIKSDKMDSLEKLGDYVGISNVKVEINNLLFKYVHDDTTIGEFEDIALSILEKIENTYDRE